MRINDNRTVLPQGTTLHGTSCSYTIIKMLGQGTFGITYLASTSYGESVAVKEFFMREINGRNGSFGNMLWILFAIVTLLFAWMRKSADTDKWFG